MPYPQFDRSKLNIKPLSERINKTEIEKDHVPLDATPHPLSDFAKPVLEDTVERIKKARENKKSVMLVFGAHTIKNGLGPVLIDLIDRGWVTHLATNGAGVIHDWEFSFQGKSCENVEKYVKEGQFGIWNETGFYINLSLIVGAYEGLGYGESVGSMIENEGLNIPSEDDLAQIIQQNILSDPEKVAGAADLLRTIQRFNLKSGWMEIPHPFKRFGIQAAAFRLKVPFTSHPMFGHDIIYNHPMNHGAAIGRTALRDFLTYANNVNNLDGGVYLSIGSAVMSPMIFEKSLAMSQNIHIQEGKHIDNHFIVVGDLAESQWDWKNSGEPPMDNPAYYLRYCKTFSRMGGTMNYVSVDNRDFLLTLNQSLPTI
ncbi:MAG: hypothetical protein KC978_07805 [Candidatus Omnitrophica bacterium]|nr:hypothetical protein [Candidatus Omnitrophota bacterium]